MRQIHGLSADGMVITLHKFQGHLEFKSEDVRGSADASATKQEPLLGIYVDVETTGLNRSQDKIIDLAYLVFRFDKASRRVVSVIKEFSALEDPEQPLSEEIKRLTGYDDGDLLGKKIPWEEVSHDFSRASVIIAHNAEFDRAFLDRYISMSQQKIWACSASQVAWKRKGHSSRALESLARDHGFFYDAHKALADVRAGLKILAMNDPDTGRSYLTELLTTASIQKKVVIAQGSSIDIKDILKKRGYRWNGSFWSICVPGDSFDEEEFINDNPQAGQAVVEYIPVKDNFKLRT